MQPNINSHSTCPAIHIQQWTLAELKTCISTAIQPSINCSKYKWLEQNPLWNVTLSWNYPLFPLSTVSFTLLFYGIKTFNQIHWHVFVWQTILKWWKTRDKSQFLVQKVNFGMGPSTWSTHSTKLIISQSFLYSASLI